VLILGSSSSPFPVYVTFVASTLPRERSWRRRCRSAGRHLIENYSQPAGRGTGDRLEGAGGDDAVQQHGGGAGITFGKIVISLISAFAIVYFRFPLRMFFFWMIFITLMLPVEVRIGPTFQVCRRPRHAQLLRRPDLPLIASATATFLFRQFFLTIPDELAEAARMDGAGPMRFFKDILVPLSRTSIAALFVIQFIYGWNQYLWPLLITTDESHVHRRSSASSA
jgi:sn-glycerol 3-phosphate transport system permease protein